MLTGVMLVLGHELLDFLLELFKLESNNLKDVKQALEFCRTTVFTLIRFWLNLVLSTLVCKSSRLETFATLYASVQLCFLY